ncbi:MAG: cobalamin biosynthesis protein [Gammaproteobacteria bacterium]|nr:cobalamin biosynthesis protein [Rhodocyclaceae bacterium]MBU3909303.1 cobalamin biosynthesis protein [Gammaproteobacteria bacterium]MBU3989706.1 cobalamin biosynthesis protein [Gammaproteobacteria bacterium]MBU4005537.1 cobalamin biosynthesis protein [Gammaproteobacteria bacterium]MBU4020910.1 cobalamin biosynthesis protein [Gammaproteobacteria bacterium]
MLATPLLAIAGVVLDRLLGEPRRFHPLVGFGRLADAAERIWRRGVPGHPIGNRLRGLAAWGMIVMPFVALAAWFAHPLVDVVLLWLVLGGKSLSEHARAVAVPLAAGDLAMARAQVGRIVSRDTTQLDEAAVATAAVESVLENGNDAVFGSLFWFFLLGGAGAVLYRLANTLDAMWGYKDARRIHFGWAAAKIDDGLNYVPARLTALTYALLGRASVAFACWRTQAGAWSSPNAGPVMAAGAGALGVQIGGAAIYHGQVEQRPILGAGGTATAADIGRAVALVERGTWLWLAAFALWSFARA